MQEWRRREKQFFCSFLPYVLVYPNFRHVHRISSSSSLFLCCSSKLSSPSSFLLISLLHSSLSLHVHHLFVLLFVISLPLYFIFFHSPHSSDSFPPTFLYLLAYCHRLHLFIPPMFPFSTSSPYVCISLNFMVKICHNNNY
jgi:hypothetical protein